MAMGDIAFNLLIFFVILARAQDDSNVQWTPPTSDQIEAGPKTPVRIAIDRKNKYFVNGVQVGGTGLEDRITAQLQGLEGKDRVVQFKIHKEAPVRLIEPVVEAIGKAGADFFIVLQKE